MAEILITCTNKNDTFSDHSGITHLGGPDGRWKKEQVIFHLNEKSNTYFTMIDNMKAEIAIYLQGYGVHLRAHANGVWNDFLLMLPKCPEPPGELAPVRIK
ncbi:MAG TPA: DUF3892 domain-containing protein [Patescibacteria group bacterium]|nr:DUF3892 domain-containing protein [Patescibacteria group bacterium]